MKTMLKNEMVKRAATVIVYAGGVCALVLHVLQNASANAAILKVAGL